MSKQINLAWGLHDFVKLPTAQKYGCDEWQCKKCGVIGLRVGFSQYIDVPQTVSDSTVHNCNIQIEMRTKNPTRVIIYNCLSFPELELRSVHDIATPPPGKRNFEGGVWIEHPKDGHLILLPYGSFMMDYSDPTHTMVRGKKPNQVSTMTRMKRGTPPAMTRGKKETPVVTMTRQPRQKPLL